MREGTGSFRLEDDVQVLLAPESDPEVNAAWSFAGEAERKANLAYFEAMISVTAVANMRSEVRLI